MKNFLLPLLFLSLCASAQIQPVGVATNVVFAHHDLVIWSGSDWVMLNKGTNGQVLTMSGTNVAWSTPAPLSGGGTGLVTSVSVDFEVDGGELSITNALGTGPLVRQSAASGSGTVTSVGLALPSIFSVSGTPVDSSGTLTGTLTAQTANRVFAGPTTGADAAPTFRALVDADVPNDITVDLATTAATANSGDSATAFFSSGTIEEARIDSAIARDSEVAAATSEATLEAILDLQDIQGAVTDAQVPNTITVDQATLALTGDSATSFFSAGEIEDARLPSGIARDSEVSATYAPLASPALTGSPTVPTASAASSNTVAASTAYVDRAVALGGGGGGSFTNTCVVGQQTTIAFSAADSTTYYAAASNFRTTFSEASVRVPISGTIIGYWVRVTRTAATGSSEDVNYYIRVNDSTDYGSTVDQWDAQFTEVWSGSLSVSVSAGDMLALKIVTPAWATNPTNAYVVFYVVIQS